MAKKRSLAIIIAMLVCSLLSTTPCMAAVTGDINGDGYFNSIDFGLMRVYLLSGSIPNYSAADVNGDSNANSIDFGYMRQYLLGIITVFPNGGTQTPTPTKTPTSTPTQTPTKIPTQTPTKIPTQTPQPTQSNGSFNDRYFSEGTSKQVMIQKASELSASQVKALIKQHVDEHYDLLAQQFGFTSKDDVYAFCFGWATRESTLNAELETAIAGWGENSAHAYGPFQTAETAFKNNYKDFMTEYDVPEMTQFDLNESNFYDVGISIHMGIRKLVHFSKDAKAKGYSGKDVLRRSVLAFNTGWVEGASESWINEYSDEIASLAGWYLNGHLSDDQWTWTGDSRVDRSNPWSWY
ncbi:dockerin type I repeat-containing protein [Acetivibrio cellulolyticus]|uniref:dockerin type I repeat-containing protein n=1 Tax=Acetivibrio cellulolyticus TaxID=35830 RepID=UPI0001E2D096|nr:dockerin type I repeat-containing protein [Acetivibrio cellulolyticus]